MNFLSKKALLALGFLGFVGSSFGYDWVINNKSDKPIIVELILQGDIPINQRYFRIIEPGRPGSFRFGGGKIGFCYKSIRVAEWDSADAAAYATKFNLSADDKATLLSAPTRDLYHVKSDPVQYYFWEYTLFHTPEIIYPKNPFDTSKIVDAMEALGNSSEKAGELIARAAAGYATGGASEAAGSAASQLGQLGTLAAKGSELMGSKTAAAAPAAKDKTAAAPAKDKSAATKSVSKSSSSGSSLDLGLAKLLSSMTGLIIEGAEKGACTGRNLDLYGVDVDVPGVKGKKEKAYIFVNRQN